MYFVIILFKTLCLIVTILQQQKYTFPHKRLVYPEDGLCEKNNYIHWFSITSDNQRAVRWLDTSWTNKWNTLSKYPSKKKKQWTKLASVSWLTSAGQPIMTHLRKSATKVGTHTSKHTSKRHPVNNNLTFLTTSGCCPLTPASSEGPPVPELQAS